MKSERELELEAELELSLLQINQLQEELEHYYLKYSDLKEQEAAYSSGHTPTQVLLTESRTNDSRYYESGFYSKSKSLQSQVAQLKQGLECSESIKVNLETEKEALSTRITELESDGRALGSSLTESRASLEASTKAREGLETEKQALSSRVTELELACRALESSLTETEAHWHQENKKLAENLHCEVGKLKEELKESSRRVGLGQKMLAKSQMDLDHLRDSYAEKVASEQGLVELANELREKLTLASRYYFDLQKEHPEILLPIENT